MNKVILSGVIGNGLEWFEYFLYAAFSSIFAKLFFPSADPVVAQISVLTIFAAGFLMRPIGALVFGIIGDKYGRRVSLSASILMMAIPTACIGLLPTYASIGIWAPITLAIIRMIQGLSLGGEFSSCIAFMIEHSPPNKRGLVGSASFVSMCMGIVMGSIVAYALSHSMSVENLESWGWRIPFILAMFIGLIGVYIRTKVQESPLYLEAKSHNNISTSPTTELITQYWKELLLAICIYLTVTVPFYTLTTYVTTYLIKNANFTLQSALIVNICAMTSAIIFLPIAAKLSDVYGRKPILLMSAAMLIVTVYPLFSLLSNATMTSAIISQIIFGAIAAFYMGPIPALLVELFPTRIRSTGVGISYNISAAVFGGTTPLVMTKMIQHSQNSQYMAYYIMIFAVLSLIALYFYQDRFKQPLL